MPIRNVDGKRPWEKFPRKELAHLSHSPSLQHQMEIRRRHRNARYQLFRLQTAEQKGEPLADPELELDGRTLKLTGFVEFWLKEQPQYMIAPVGEGKWTRVDVPPALKGKTVAQFGGFKTFGQKWDVDPDLYVYLRHMSIHQEWNAKLARVVPILDL